MSHSDREDPLPHHSVDAILKVNDMGVVRTAVTPEAGPHSHDAGRRIPERDGLPTRPNREFDCRQAAPRGSRRPHPNRRFLPQPTAATR